MNNDPTSPMVSLAQRLKGAGANDATINVVLLMFVTFVFLCGLGAAFLIGWQVFKGTTPSPFLIVFVGSIFGLVSALGVATHQASTINGTAAKTASNTASNMQPAIAAISQAGDTNAQTIQQLLLAVMDMQRQLQSSSIQANSTLAKAAATQLVTATDNSQVTAENTAATEENTTAIMHPPVPNIDTSHG